MAGSDVTLDPRGLWFEVRLYRNMPRSRAQHPWLLMVEPLWHSFVKRGSSLDQVRDFEFQDEKVSGLETKFI